MKKEELRIGNYVGHIKTHEIGCVEYLSHSTTLSFKNRRLGTGYDDLKPIPITQEILNELGVNSLGCLVLMDNDVYIKINDDNECIVDGFCAVKYVHELQNLVYVISGGYEMKFKDVVEKPKTIEISLTDLNELIDKLTELKNK